MPPRQSSSRSLVHRLRGSLEAARRHTRLNSRASASGSSPNVSVHLKKSATTATSRTRSSKGSSKPLDFTVTILPAPISDVEMGDATASTSAPRKTQVQMPRELPRPAFEEIDYERLTEIDDSLKDVPITFLRQHLHVMGQDFLQSLGSTTIPQSKTLSKEIDIMINDMTSIAPSHVLAVTGPKRPGAKSTKVSLYAVHSVVFAAQCSRMPKFPPMLPLPPHQAGSQTVRVPVFPISVPHATSFPQLLKFLYCKRPTSLIREMIPLAPPPGLFEDQDPSQVIHYATELAKTFTDAKLVQVAGEVHGLWRNLCGFCVDDELLWNTLDLMWRICLTALAISTGKPEVMISPPSTQSSSTSS
ncbi:hypothetical protein CPB83DRAFT_796601 [Crepidotus variabilis]|uniref:Clp1-like protein n=1 Tax=Crepidotus variabilis TaxID=179855 RepID=A0A9P6JLK3_9AGAR|nr:hypothetical protein CPB83DRAFT_796601 [Crepidotus variabilis]